VLLQIHGYVVLRFTNVQVFDDVENVLALLQQLLADRRCWSGPGKPSSVSADVEADPNP